MDTFAPPPDAHEHPRCPSCHKRLYGSIWGAVLRCRRCKSLLLVVAGQPVRVVAETADEAVSQRAAA